MKQCPSCEKSIAPQLVVCPHCGHDFEQSKPDSGKQTMMGIPATDLMAQLRQLKQDQPAKAPERPKSTMFGLPSVSREDFDASQEEDSEDFGPTQIIAPVDVPELGGGPQFPNAARSTLPGGLPALTRQDADKAFEADKPFSKRPQSSSTMMLGSLAAFNPPTSQSPEEDSEMDDEPMSKTMVAGPINFADMGNENTSAFSKMQPTVDHGQDKNSSTLTGLNIKELAAGMVNQAPEESSGRQTMFSIPSPFQQSEGEDDLLEMSEPENDSSSIDLSQSATQSAISRSIDDEDTRQRLLAKLRSSKPETEEVEDTGKSTMFGIPGITRPSAHTTSERKAEDSGKNTIFSIPGKTKTSGESKAFSSDDEPKESGIFTHENIELADNAPSGVLGRSSYAFTQDSLSERSTNLVDSIPKADDIDQVDAFGETLPFSFSAKDMLEGLVDEAPQDAPPQDIDEVKDVVEEEINAPEPNPPEQHSHNVFASQDLVPVTNHAQDEKEDSQPDALSESSQPVKDNTFELTMPSTESSHDSGLLNTQPTKPKPTPTPLSSPDMAVSHVDQSASQLPVAPPAERHDVEALVMRTTNELEQVQPVGGLSNVLQRGFGVVAGLSLVGATVLGFVMASAPLAVMGKAIFGLSAVLGVFALVASALSQSRRRILLSLVGVVSLVVFVLAVSNSMMGIGALLLCIGALFALAGVALSFF